MSPLKLPQLKLSGERGGRFRGGNKPHHIERQRYSFGREWVVVGKERKGKIVSFRNGDAFVDIGLGKNQLGVIRKKDAKNLKVGDEVAVEVAQIKEFPGKIFRGRKQPSQIGIELKLSPDRIVAKPIDSSSPPIEQTLDLPEGCEISEVVSEYYYPKTSEVRFVSIGDNLYVNRMFMTKHDHVRVKLIKLPFKIYSGRLVQVYGKDSSKSRIDAFCSLKFWVRMQRGFDLSGSQMIEHLKGMAKRAGILVEDAPAQRKLGANEFVVRSKKGAMIVPELEVALDLVRVEGRKEGFVLHPSFSQGVEIGGVVVSTGCRILGSEYCVAPRDLQRWKESSQLLEIKRFIDRVGQPSVRDDVSGPGVPTETAGIIAAIRCKKEHYEHIIRLPDGTKTMLLMKFATQADHGHVREIVRIGDEVIFSQFLNEYVPAYCSLSFYEAAERLVEMMKREDRFVCQRVVEGGSGARTYLLEAVPPLGGESPGFFPLVDVEGKVMDPYMSRLGSPTFTLKMPGFDLADGAMGLLKAMCHSNFEAVVV